MRKRIDTIPVYLVASSNYETIYRLARLDLKRLIYAAKAKSWEDLVRTTETYPWVKPYKMSWVNLEVPRNGFAGAWEDRGNCTRSVPR